MGNSFQKKIKFDANFLLPFSELEFFERIPIEYKKSSRKPW